MDHTTLIIFQTKLKKMKDYFRCGSLKLLVLLHFMLPVNRLYMILQCCKENASMAGNLHIIQTVFHIVSCGKVL